MLKHIDVLNKLLNIVNNQMTYRETTFIFDDES